MLYPKYILSILFIVIFSIVNLSLAIAAEYPIWFKPSSYNLQQDLAQSIKDNKQGIMLYFGHPHCPYCHAQMKTNWNEYEEYVELSKTYFNTYGFNVYDDNFLIDFKGKDSTVRNFANQHNATYTPSILFYTLQGEEILHLRGYYPPYYFGAALRYFIKKYYTQESFEDYLARADILPKFEEDALNYEDFFIPISQGPIILDRSLMSAERPMIVFFEAKKCHACDLLHGIIQDNENIETLLSTEYDAIQLNRWHDKKLITPTGKRSSVTQWAKDLNLTMSPTVIIFDYNGKELLRLETIKDFYQLEDILNNILS